MEAFEKLRSILEGLTYKKNWAFSVKEPYDERSPLPAIISFEAEDVDEEGVFIEVRAHEFFGQNEIKNLSEEEILRRIEAGVLTLEKHEANEWLKYKGVCVTKPKHTV